MARVTIQSLMRKAFAAPVLPEPDLIPPSREVAEHEANETAMWHLRGLLRMRAGIQNAFADLPLTEEHDG